MLSVPAVEGMEGQPTIVKMSPWHKLKRHFSEAFSEQFEYLRVDFNAQGMSRQIRKRGRDAYRYILLLLACVLAPMLAHNFYTGQWLLALATFILLCVIFANIWLLTRSRQAFLSPTVLLSLGILLILFAVLLGQQYSLFWLYPLLAGLPVLLRSRRAMLIGLGAGALSVPLIFAQFPLRTAIVISVSLGLTWLVSAWLVFAVTEQSRRLRDMAITDPLTGAYNRRYLEEQALHAMEYWQRYRHPATLLLIDIDHFKRVNDKYGHTVGDMAIKRLVEVISGRIRSVDILCRYGGEEFVVLLNQTGIGGGVKIAEELRELVAHSNVLPQGKITISIGVCEVMAADSLDQWFNMADSALYMAKRSGRNRVESASHAPLARGPIDKTVPDWR
jgi:diguanylate cyclase (GGDEF)-like protein